MNRAIDTTAKAQPGYDLFVFGDSLSDIGQLFQKTGLPPAPYFNGRFSNGPLAVETLASDLGVNISLNTDFAIGGAYSGRQNVNDTATVKFGGVLDQIDQFKAKAATLGADAQDLYFIWAGGNDFLIYLPLQPQQKSKPQLHQPFPISLPQQPAWHNLEQKILWWLRLQTWVEYRS